MTLISVLTPSLNYRRFLEDAILSVHLQKGVEVEHIVQDGGSLDGTIEVLRKYSGVRWASMPDQGQSDALNKALYRARGDWIAWLNADEFLLPGALSHLLNYALSTKADVVYGDCIFVDVIGRFLRLRSAHSFNKFVLWHYGPFIPSCAILIRRDLLGEEPWNIDVNLVMDWQVYLELTLKKARFAWTPWPIGAFRVHSAQISAQSRTRFTQAYRFLKEHYKARPTRFHYKLGYLLHGFLKWQSGCYKRERCSSTFRKKSFRWFADKEGMTNFEKLVKGCYYKR